MSETKKMVSRLWILLAILTAGFGSIYLLPEQGEMIPSQLSQDLPKELGSWTSVKRSVSDVEKKVLAADTEFARRSYHSSQHPGFSGIEMSVVFSGKDINNSLHRPEVCLRAQGWNFIRERSVVIPSALPGGKGLPVREIVCVRPRVKNGSKEPPKNKDGEPVYDKLVQYYTFFGSEAIVSGHYERTLEDIKGRLIGGYDQQWAYATFSVAVTSVYVDQGFKLPEHEIYDEAQSIEMLEEFIQTVMPEVLVERL